MADRPTPPRGPLGSDQPTPPIGPLAVPERSDQPTPPIGPLAVPLGTDQPTPPIGPLASAHPTHDQLLIAAFASDDLDGAARTDAAELVASCSACATLAADLRALAAATRALPPAHRPRDFALGQADAARLRPRGLRRFLAALAAPRSLSRPLAASLTTLGVAGLLLASLPGIVPLGIGGAATEGLQDVDTVVPLDGSSGQAPAPSAAPGISFGDDRDTSGEGSPTGPDVEDPAPTTIADAVDDSAPTVLAVLSGSFLIAGLGLFALRWTGRRLGSG